MISGADVVKGAQASLSEGAIGGLINLRSASPFDQDGQQGVIRLEGDRNQMSELNGHKFSATYSYLFADNKLGVLLGVVYGKRKDRTDIAGNDGGWSRYAAVSYSHLDVDKRQPTCMPTWTLPPSWSRRARMASS